MKIKNSRIIYVVTTPFDYLFFRIFKTKKEVLTFIKEEGGMEAKKINKFKRVKLDL